MNARPAAIRFCSSRARRRRLRGAALCVLGLLLALSTQLPAVGAPAGEPTRPAPEPHTRPAPPPGGYLGEYYYGRGQYQLARIEFERQVLAGGSGESAARARLALALMRESRFRESLPYLNNRRDFAHVYLRMFATFRAGWAFQGLADESTILDNADFSTEQKDFTRLVGGTVYLEEADLTSARKHYTRLQAESESPEVRELSGRVLTSLAGYESLDHKQPLLAAGLSVLLPGAGQVYSDAYADGATALFFNAAFLGGAGVLYGLEERADTGHVASGIFGVIGLVFYLANVTGAYQAAGRYNDYQTRRFHQEIRDAFFHLDFMERTSGVSFQTSF